MLVADVIDKDDAVGVVDFVLDNSSEEALGLKADFVTFEVERFDTNF